MIQLALRDRTPRRLANQHITRYSLVSPPSDVYHPGETSLIIHYILHETPRTFSNIYQSLYNFPPVMRFTENIESDSRLSTRIVMEGFRPSRRYH
jgi:hypothetical protein